MSPNQAQLPKANILVVDDSSSNLRLLSTMLNEKGYKVRGVKNGQMALTAAQSAPPDLILLDVNMPQMNGYEVCRQLKFNAITAEIPVIFISGFDDMANRVRAFSQGGVDYIAKPFQLEEVSTRIENQLTLISLKRQLQAQTVQLQQELDEHKRLLLEQEQIVEMENRQCQHYLTALVEVEQALLNTKANQDSYPKILQSLGRAAGVSRVSWFENQQNAANQLCMCLQAEWCADSISPKLKDPLWQNLPYAEFFPRWAEILAKRENIAEIVTELPRSERKILEPLAILAILSVPILVRGQFWGFLSFDNCTEARMWKSTEIDFLNVAATAIARWQEDHKSYL
ncbi:MAG: response regulator [Cyanothece sp. SIO1E1]|nr:response regulator [Cyanothece sp. SIO1E1]